MNKKLLMTTLLLGGVAITSYSFASANTDVPTTKLAADGINIETTQIIDGEEVTMSTAVGIAPTVDEQLFFDVVTDDALKDAVLATSTSNAEELQQYTPDELQIAFNSMNDDEWFAFSNALTAEQWAALDAYMYGL